MRLLRKSNIKGNSGPPSLIRTKRKPKDEARLPSGKRKMYRPEMKLISMLVADSPLEREEHVFVFTCLNYFEPARRPKSRILLQTQTFKAN